MAASPQAWLPELTTTPDDPRLEPSAAWERAVVVVAGAAV